LLAPIASILPESISTKTGRKIFRYFVFFFNEINNWSSINANP
jgi:hypothetical protein